MDMEHKPPSKVLGILSLVLWFQTFVKKLKATLLKGFNVIQKEFGQKTNWLLSKEVLLLFRPTIIGNIHLTNKINNYDNTKQKITVHFR